MIQWLTDTLAMTGLLMALVLVLRGPVGRWFGAGAAYALWALPMTRLVLPPLSLPRGLLPHYAVAVEKITASASVPAEAVITGGAAAVPIAVNVTPGTTAHAGLLAHVPWSALLLAVWLGGAGLFLAWRVIGYRTMRRELLQDARLMAHAGDVRIIESPAAAAPLAFGVFDKVIALPMGFLATADSETSDLAIAHELEHHTGSDFLALMAMQPLFALHWFNPVSWAAWRALRSDQEAACDARVMVGRGGQERALYGRLIASFAGGRRLALMAPMAGPLSGEKPIIHRLKALARQDVGPVRGVLARSLFAMAVIALPATATVYAAIEDGAPGDGPAWRDGPTASASPTALRVQGAAADSVEASVMPAPSTVQRADPAAPVPPALPAARDKVLAGREATGESPDAMRRAADAWRQAAEAERRADQAIARAPRVEETVTADGRKVIRLVRTNEAGASEVIREMVMDDRCPADSNRGAAGVGPGRGNASVLICTGAPRAAASATVDALRSARNAVEANRALDEGVRAEVLADLDGQIADALEEQND